MIYHPSIGGQPKTAPIKNNGKIEKDYAINWGKMQKVIDDLHKKPSVIPISDYLRHGGGYDAPFGRGPKPRDPIMKPVVDREPGKQPVLQNPLEGFWGKPVTTNPTPAVNPRLDQRIKDEIVKLKSGKAKPSNSESKVDKGLKSQTEVNLKEMKSKRNYKL